MSPPTITSPSVRQPRQRSFTPVPRLPASPTNPNPTQDTQPAPTRANHPSAPQARLPYSCPGGAAVSAVPGRPQRRPAQQTTFRPNHPRHPAPGTLLLRPDLHKAPRGRGTRPLQLASLPPRPASSTREVCG
jgi:hypothetical protein